MTAPDDLRILRAAEHHARSVSKEFDAHVIDCAGSLKPMVFAGVHILLGQTSDGTVCIRLDGTNVSLCHWSAAYGIDNMEETICRVPLPGHLRRQLSRLKETS